MGDELDPSLYTESEAAALDFAERLTLESTEVPAETMAALRRHFDEGEVVEIALAAGLFNYFNRVNNALDVPPTAPSPYLDRERD